MDRAWTSELRLALRPGSTPRSDPRVCPIGNPLRPGRRVCIYAPNRLYLFETHGVYLGTRFIFRLIPFVNWLPDPLRNRFCPHVRAYTRRGIRRLFSGTPSRIVQLGYVYPGFDNV